jgi:DDE superfamily endonuclease
MSRRRWNTVLERSRLYATSYLLQGIVEYEVMTADDDNDSSSSISSVSSLSSIDDSDDDSSTTSSLILDVAKSLLELAYRVFQSVEDETITFGQKKTIADFTEAECVSDFRFRKDDLQHVANELWPRLAPFLGEDKNNLLLENRYHAPYETCLLVYLFKMARPRRLRPDCEAKFGMKKSHLSVIVRSFGSALLRLSHRYLNDPGIWHERMPYYGQLIWRKCGLFDNIWGLIDGTIRKTCRPIRYQNLFWTKYKKCHGIKFQSIVVPDGYIACLWGPFPAKRHDARMLRESGLMERLRQLMPANLSNGRVYTLYGDLAYPQSIWLFGGYVNPEPNSPRAQFNKLMSKARIAVEWGFAQIIVQWSHLDFRASMKIFQEPIAQQYLNCAFLCNIRCCFYGNQTSNYFGGKPFSVEEYLGLID